MPYSGQSLINTALTLLDDDETMFSRTVLLAEIQSKLRDVLNKYPFADFNFPVETDVTASTGVGGVEIAVDLGISDFLKDVSVSLDLYDAVYADPKVFNKLHNNIELKKPTILDPIYTVKNGFMYFSPDNDYALVLDYVPLVTLVDNATTLEDVCDDELLEFAMYGAVGYLASIDDYASITAEKYMKLYHSKVSPQIGKR